MLKLNLNILLSFCLSLLVFFDGFTQSKNLGLEQKDSLYNYLKKSEEFDTVAKLSHDISINFYKQRDYINALKFAKVEVEIGLKGLDSLLYKRAIFNLGLFHLKNDNYYQSIAAHQKVIDSFDIDKRTFQSYCEIGRVYRKLGDYYQAASHLEKGISQPKYFSDLEKIINYSNLLDIYDTYDTHINNFLIKKHELLNKVDSLLRLDNFKDIYKINNEINFGNYYSNEEVLDPKKAKYHFNIALNVAKQKNDKRQIALINNNLAYLYNLTDNDSALYFVKKGLDISRPDDQIRVKLYGNLSEYHHRKCNVVSALKANTKELALLLPDYLKINSESTPGIEHLSLSRDKTHTVFTLKNRALYLIEKYESFNDLKAIRLARETLIQADHLIDNIKKESIAVQNKLFWQREASEIYMLAIKACYLLKDNKTAFYFMEKKKAVLLLDNLSERALRKQIKIPDSILEQEFSLKQSIAELENKIYYSDTSELDSLTNSLNSLKIQHTAFLVKLKDDYKDYYESKVTGNIIDLKEIQENLDKQSVILEYAINNSDGYLIMIRTEKVSFFNFKDIQNLIGKINTFNDDISKPYTTNTDLLDYKKSAYLLYKELVPESLDNITNLTIIPDYNLQFLPFEALLKSNNDEDYLIKNCDIAYAYSMSFSKNNSKTISEYNADISAFAPLTFNNGLSELNYTKNELRQIKRLFKGNFYLDDSAKKRNFINNISDSQIIHLATHANASDTISPWISFKNEKLFLNEIYNSYNQAELVTLSACNTSLGKSHEGEGIFSLARGFFHSGSKSVASTLWSVNDKSTTLIIDEFYENLNKGQTKSEALRHAKLNYIDTHSLSEKSPYYWASVIVIGDTSPIELSNRFPLYYYIVITIFLLLIIISFFKKTKI